MDSPLRRPTARIRRLLAVAQFAGVTAVGALAFVVGGAVQHQLEAHAARPATLVEAPGGLVLRDGPAEDDGVLVGIGTVIVGWTLVGCAGTVARRRLDDRDSVRWEREWCAVEPTWSGRVS